MAKFSAEETFKLLLNEYETLHIPASVIAKKYLSIDKKVFFQKFNDGELPFPTFRASGSRKAPVMADLRDVALWLDRVRNEHQDDWTQLQS